MKRTHVAALAVIACALAADTGQPLLFQGDDFTHTDVTPALSLN